MKFQTHQSSGEGCAFFRKKIGVYLHRLIAARIIAGASTILSETMRIDARDGRSDSCYQRRSNQ